jgi:hypothetical protein
MIFLVLDCRKAVERLLVDMDVTKLAQCTAQKEGG